MRNHVSSAAGNPFKNREHYPCILMWDLARQRNPNLDVPKPRFYADADLGFATPRAGTHRGVTPTECASPGFDTHSGRDVHPDS